MPPFPPDEEHQHAGGENGEQGYLGIAEPVLLLAFVEDEFKAADTAGDEAEPDGVDFARDVFLRQQVRRILDHAVAEVEREQADRQVDEEYPVPVEVVGDPAAERRTDGRRADHGHSVNGEGLAAFGDREGVGEDGLLAGSKAAAAESLKDAGG